jgi:hypothetical protein
MKKIAEGEIFDMNGKTYSYRINESGGIVLSLSPQSNVKQAKNNLKSTFKPPTIDEVVDYFKERGYSESAAQKFYDYYSSAEWKDSKGSQVKNWKQKAVGIWFKDENKIQVERQKGMVR